jgi:hypothetical protein
VHFPPVFIVFEPLDFCFACKYVFCVVWCLQLVDAIALSVLQVPCQCCKGMLQHFQDKQQAADASPNQPRLGALSVWPANAVSCLQ